MVKRSVASAAKGAARAYRAQIALETAGEEGMRGLPTFWNLWRSGALGRERTKRDRALEMARKRVYAYEKSGLKADLSLIGKVALMFGVPPLALASYLYFMDHEDPIGTAGAFTMLVSLAGGRS